MHSAPVDEAVNVVGEEHDKARERGNVSGVCDGRHCPEDNKNDVVERVSDRVVRRATGGEEHRGEAGSYRNRADYEVCVAERAEDEIERGGDCGGENRHYYEIPGAERVYPYFALRVRVTEPRDEREQRHGRGHSEIGNHFAVVTERQRDYSVEHRETQHQNLPDRVAFRAEYYRGHAHERAAKREVIASVEDQERSDDYAYRYEPDRDFRGGEISFFLHCFLLVFPSKKHPQTRLQRPNDASMGALHFSARWQIFIS